MKTINGIILWLRAVSLTSILLLILFDVTLNIDLLQLFNETIIHLIVVFYVSLFCASQIVIDLEKLKNKEDEIN